MTTIAANRQEIACDLKFTGLDGGAFKGKTKIYEFDPHELSYPSSEFFVGFAGAASSIIEIAEFFSRPESFRKAPTVKGVTGIVLTRKGDLFVFDDYRIWLAVNQPFMAIGTGAPAAMGAMHQGASPREAVRAASKIDPFTGMGTKVFSR